MHGNFIVNAGNATARDVLDLIQHVKDTIYNLYEIKMETEVEIIGGRKIKARYSLILVRNPLRMTNIVI